MHRCRLFLRALVRGLRRSGSAAFGRLLAEFSSILPTTSSPDMPDSGFLLFDRDRVIDDDGASEASGGSF